MVAIGVKSATAPAVRSCEGDAEAHRTATTTMFDYLDWNRDQNKGKGVGSQMVVFVLIRRFKKEFWISACVWKDHDVARKCPLLRSAGFNQWFHMAYPNHLSHTLIPNMQNFVAWIMPPNPAWTSNHASDHTSEVYIQFIHMSSTDAPRPNSKTSNWCHNLYDAWS